MSNHGLDWTTDFDDLGPDYLKEPEQTGGLLREECSIGFTQRRSRTWVPVVYATDHLDVTGLQDR